VRRSMPGTKRVCIEPAVLRALTVRPSLLGLLTNRRIKAMLTQLINHPTTQHPESVPRVSKPSGWTGLINTFQINEGIEDRIERWSLTITGYRYLEFDDSGGIDEQNTRARYAVATFAGTIVFIANSIGIDMLDVFILQQGVVEVIFGMKIGQNAALIVGHRGNIHTDLRKFFLPLCQLDQLAFTKGSPVGGTIHKQ